MTLTRVNSNGITDGTVVNADVSASAAIAGTKVSPDFGSQAVTTTGTSTAASFIPTSSSVPANGVYLPGANALGLATASTERVRVTSAGLVGIGTTSPGFPLDLVSVSGESVRLRGTSGTEVSKLLFTSNTAGADYGYLTSASGYLAFGYGASERARIDSSGRLLVGTSSTSAGSTAILQGWSGDSTGSGILRLCRGQATPNNNTELGYVIFGDSTHTDAATITAWRDGGTWSGSSKPTRLTFSTCPDSGSSPVERMRIDSAGRLLVGTTDPSIGGGAASSTFASGAGVAHPVKVAANDASFAESGGGVFPVGCLRSASSAYTFIGCYSGNSSATIWNDKEFGLRGDGNAFADGSWSGGGADYAEYFEWSDSNPNAEDRRGVSVVLDGDKIREAVAGEDPIGVISGNPSVVGDAAWNKWNGKYLRDEFGTYIQEDYEVEDEDGNTVVQQRRKLNPAYDPDVEYTSREQRPEWDCVGLMGKLRIRKGQITGSRWIKMRDISATVEEWLVR